MIIRIDFHVHTVYSDGIITPEYIIKKAVKYGLNAVSKSDHNTTRGNGLLKRLAERMGLLFIPSVEISAKGGHILGINLEYWPPEKSGKSIEETADFIRAEGGVPVLAHPYWRGSPGDATPLLKGLAGIELYNHSSPLGSAKLLRKVGENPEFVKLPFYAGSDAHGGAAFGKLYTEISVEEPTREAVIEALYAGKVRPVGLPLSEMLVLYILDGIPNVIGDAVRKIRKKLGIPR